MSSATTLLDCTEEIRINRAENDGVRSCWKQCTGNKWTMTQTNPTQIWAWTITSNVHKLRNFCEP